MNNKGNQSYQVPSSSSAMVQGPNVNGSAKKPTTVKGGDLRAKGSK